MASTYSLFIELRFATKGRASTNHTSRSINENRSMNALFNKNREKITLELQLTISQGECSEHVRRLGFLKILTKQFSHVYYRVVRMEIM